MRDANSPIFRRLEPRDADALSALFERNNTVEVTRYFHPFPLTDASARQLVARVATSRDIYEGAWLGDLLVGFFMLRGWDEGYSVPSFGVLVDSDRAGRGLGRALTQRAMEEARAAGARQVRLSVFEANRAAQLLYRSLGFAVCEERTRDGLLEFVMLRSLDTDGRS